MILLPNIELGINGQRHLLSIQEPFTLDGYLITEFDILDEMEFSYQSIPSKRIEIRNENDFCVQLRSDELEYRFDSEMYYFRNRYGIHACVEGRRDIGDWSDYDFDKYIREIKEQCDRIHDNRFYSSDYGSNYLNALRNDLRRQGRVSCEPIRLTRGGRSFFTNEYLYNWGASFGINTDAALDAFRNVSERMFGVWNSESTPARKYIHSYNYKPEYIRYYMPDEDKDTTLILGAEIEVAGNEKEPNRDDVVKKCIQIMNGSEDDTENLIYSTSDSTVQIELDTMPCSLEFHKNKMNYKEMFEYLDELGYKGHDCSKAGLHIHACRSYLGKSELIQQLTISKILYIIEKFNDEICVIARRNNDYCKFVGKEEVNQSLDKLYGKYKDNGKKVALNLQHKDTIEFRMFRSTLKYETFILTLEFVKDIIDFAKSINIEQIELIKWSDLMNTFSDELKKYYNDRLEKENKKKTEKPEKKEDDPSDVTTWRSGTINSNMTIYSLSEMRNLLNQFPTQLESVYAPFPIEYDNKTTEEKLKDKIKSLKKQIKNSNNFMEKKNLEKELNEAQKELKKEKKKNKLNNNASSAFVCA